VRSIDPKVRLADFSGLGKVDKHFGVIAWPEVLLAFLVAESNYPRTKSYEHGKGINCRRIDLRPFRHMLVAVNTVLSFHRLRFTVPDIL